jgi:hypothetical protein
MLSTESKTLFKRYLKKLKSPRHYMTESWSDFIQSQPRGVQDRVHRRFREINPEEFEEYVKYHRKLGHMRYRQQETVKRLALVEAEKRVMVATETHRDKTLGVSIIKMVPLEGVQRAIAACAAAGYSTKDVAGFFQIEETDVNAILSADGRDPMEVIAEAVQDMPKAIPKLANRLVMRDLLSGTVTKATMAAEKIATGRMKLAIDASAERRATVRAESDAELKQRAEERNKRFNKEGAGT